MTFNVLSETIPTYIWDGVNKRILSAYSLIIIRYAYLTNVIINVDNNTTNNNLLHGISILIYNQI